MPISPAVRQVGSLKGNSRRCQVDGIKPVWGVLPIMHGDSSSSPVPGALNNSSPVPGVRSLLLSSSSSPVPGARKLPLSSNRQAPGARKLPLSNNLRPGVTRAPVHHRRVLAWEETNLVGMPLSRPSNRQPRSHRTLGGNPQHLLCSREHQYGGVCQGGRQCKIAPRHNNSKRLPPMGGAVLDSRGVNLTSRHPRSKDGDNLPNSSQLQHLHLRQVAIRVCHHGSKDQALGKVRDLAPLV